MILERNEAKTAVGPESPPSGSTEKHIELPRAYSGPNALTNLLSDSIGEALTDLLGSRAREAIYDHMERNHSVARNEIPAHLDDLFKLFGRYFGVGSKNVIGRVIARKVYSNLGWEFVSIPHFEFADYLEKIRTRIAKEGFGSPCFGRALDL